MALFEVATVTQTEQLYSSAEAQALLATPPTYFDDGPGGFNPLPLVQYFARNSQGTLIATVTLQSVTIETSVPANGPVVPFFDPVTGVVVDSIFAFYSTSVAYSGPSPAGTGLYPTIPQLFTVQGETVDFNKLKPAQQQAIDNGADTTQGLGGNDNVTLPDVGHYKLTSKVTWDPTKTFVETDTAGQHVTINSGNGFENIKVGNGNDTINIGASGGNVTIGSGSDTVTSSAATSTANPNANATTVGFTGINFNSGVTFAHSTPANPLAGGTYTNANLSIGNLFFTYQGGKNVNVSAGSQLDTFSNVQFVQSGDAGGSGSKLPLDAIHIVVSLDSDGFGTISATDNGQPISGLQSNVTCAFDQLMPVPNGTYDVVYRTNAGTTKAFEFSDYNGVSWFGPNRTNIQLHIGNNPGDSIGCIVVGNNGNASNGGNSQFWNTLTTIFMDTLVAGMATATGQFGQTFYRLPIPITLTVDSPVQPKLHIERPSTVGDTSSVKFKIDGLSTSSIIDKDIDFYFTVSGAPANSYTVFGALYEQTLADGSALYRGTIFGTQNHTDNPSVPADTTISIIYDGSTPEVLTLKLVPESPEGTYYDGTRYSTTHGAVHDYAPPSQPLIDLNALSQTVTFGATATASISNIQNDFLAIARTALPLDQATAITNSINVGTQTETQYVIDLLSQVANTTIPAVAVEASMYGATGTSAEITNLVVNFLPAQVANAINHGLNPQVYACEVVGLAFAFGNETDSTAFSDNFSPSTIPSDAAFAAAACGTIFGGASTANLVNVLGSFVANWKAFYTSAGIPGNATPTAAQIDLASRGAAWGDMVGVALANNIGPLNGQVVNFLEDAAQGTAIYGASLVGQPAHQPFV